MAATPAPAPTALYNLEIEHSALAALLQHPKTWGDFYLIGRDDFSKLNQPLWDLISAQLSVSPQGSVAPLILAEKMKSYGTATIDSVDVYDLLSGLTLRFVEEKDAPHLARELKRLTVRRQLVDKMDVARKELIARPAASFEEMTGLVEKQLSSVTTEYYKGDEFQPVFGDFVEVIEERGRNPIDASKMGWQGPFESMNRTLGALLAPGLFVCIGARTGNAKSALGFYYNLMVAEKHNLPVLLMDVGEMSLRRIQDRAACCLSLGRIPLWAIKSGEYALNKDWRRIWEEEIKPRVKGLRIDYINVGGKSPREKLSLIRRYYYNRIGRGNPVLLLDDYLKGVEALGKNTSEYQSVGYYVEDMKSLITNEINASLWSSVQNNRSGVYQGKSAKDIVDSEDQMGLSDRIIQQSDWGFILRFKVPEEIGSERQLFGNMRMTPVKTREAMGKEFEKALRPVKMPNGRFVVNHFNIDNKGFHFNEKGDLRFALEQLGDGIVDLGVDEPAKEKAKSEKPQPAQPL